MPTVNEPEAVPVEEKTRGGLKAKAKEPTFRLTEPFGVPPLIENDRLEPCATVVGLTEIANPEGGVVDFLKEFRYR